MQGNHSRGVPAIRTLAVLLLGLFLAFSVGCGGSGGGGPAWFDVRAVFAASSSRDLPSFAGSIKVSISPPAKQGASEMCLNRSDDSDSFAVDCNKDYTFTVVAYRNADCTGEVVGNTSFVRHSPPKSGMREEVVINTVDTEDVHDVTVTAPRPIICGSTVEIMAEAHNAAGHVLFTCGNDSSLDITVDPPNAGSMVWNAGKCLFTATTDLSMDGTTVRFTARLPGGPEGSNTSVLDCQVSDVVVDLCWNADTRGLPGFARSASVTLLQNGNIICGPKIVSRSSSGEHKTRLQLCDDKVPDGQYVVRLEAFTGVDATGNMCASQDFPITVPGNPDPIEICMDNGNFDDIRCQYTVRRTGGDSFFGPGATLILLEGETVEVFAEAINGSGQLCLVGDDIKLTFTGFGLQQIDNNHVKATVRGPGTVTCNFGEGSETTPVNVVFGNPGIIIIWDPPTRDPAPGYAKSAQAEIFDGSGSPIPGFAPLCVNRPASNTSAAYWNQSLPPGTTYSIHVTLFPEINCVGPALMEADSGPQVVPANGAVGPSTFDFPTVGNVTHVEVTVTRGDGTIERYVDISPPPAGRRNGPLFLSSGEQVTITTRATDDAGTVTFFSGVKTSVDNEVTSYNDTNGRLNANRLGLTFLTASAQPGRGPEMVLETRVMQPGIVAFSDWDPDAFGGTGAVKTYLYVPGSRVTSPDGDKIWEVPYRDSAYIGRPVAEPGVVLPTGFINGYDVVMPAINSRANRLAFVVAPFDTVSGNLTYYKDLVVMDISYDDNGAPIFGAIRPQNEMFDTSDQTTPQWGPQRDDNLDGILYYASMEFDRNTGGFLGGQQRDIYERTSVDGASGPGNNITSGIIGNLMWPAVSPDGVELAVIRKDGFGLDESSTTGVGKIITIDLATLAPSGEQIDVTTSAESRIGYVASKGIQVPGSSDPSTLVNPDKYYIAFARSFDGGITTEVELIRAERTQSALGAYIVQQQNASSPFCAAIDGTAGNEFGVRNPRRVMCFLFNNTEVRVKNITSPAAGGIGSLITTLDPSMANTSIPSQPAFPAPFDVFDPLPR